ncbi:esterase [Streptomyces sp. SID5785]|uniref:alpha/beta hydrolase n=1 Tax=Streptomyces sp. SID5785 TaxID=2690309 RepID=UPI001361277C|nr:alpha/beta hydrolase-fold protein [Streptomyces sp. SID5785]MZD09096.1 esterase [Streptomyces sp. SID5785]MZD09890.1 esterase [Streptomyces sp. SID5785]
MGLTSHKVLALAVLCAVVLFLGTVLLWPRLAHRSWRAVTGRVALLLGTQLAVFCAVGLAVNQSFGFYASWADLLGREQSQGVVTDAAVAGGGARRVHWVSSGGLTAPPGSRPGSLGRIERIDVAGRGTGIGSPAYVYLPPEYFQERYAHRHFPAAVVLTGYPGTAEALYRGLRYPQTAYRLAAAHRMRPMILVMMRPTVAPPRDTECVDVPGGPRAETFFARDLPAEVAARYRTERRWGIVGDSTGGYCALKLALHHPGVYRAGAGLSAYYRAPLDPTTGDLFHGDRALRDRADLMRVLDRAPGPDTSLLVTTSRQGEHNYPDTMAFLRKVKPPTRASSIVLDSGGHNFNTWRREIPATLEWLSARLSE